MHWIGLSVPRRPQINKNPFFFGVSESMLPLPPFLGPRSQADMEAADHLAFLVFIVVLASLPPLLKDSVVLFKQKIRNKTRQASREISGCWEQRGERGSGQMPTECSVNTDTVLLYLETRKLILMVGGAGRKEKREGLG